MPILALTLDEVKKTICNNVIFKIIDDLKVKTKLARDISIIYNDDMDVAKTNLQDNATSQSSPLPTVSSQRRINIFAREEFNQDDITSTAVLQNNSFPIFRDNTNDIFINLIYLKVDYTLEVAYTSPSRTECIRWRDDIRARLSQMQSHMVHDVKYIVFLPTIVQDFISDMHENINRLSPIDVVEYFRIYGDNRLQLYTDLNSNNPQIGLEEIQSRILGLYDFSPLPEEIEKDKDTGTYTVKFNYKFSFDRPALVRIMYPFMVANRIVPSKYLEHITNALNYQNEEQRKPLVYTQSGHFLSHFEAHRQLEYRLNTNLPLRIPYFDDYQERKLFPGYALQASMLVDINETDKRTLLNLNDLKQYYIREPILQYIINGEKDYITKPYQSFIYIGVSQKDKHFNNYILTIDKDLNIKSTIDLDLMRETRIIFNFVYDLTYLDKAALRRAALNQDVYLLFLMEYLMIHINYPDLTKDNNTFDIFDHLTNMIYEMMSQGQYDFVSKILNTLQSAYIVLYQNYLAMLKNNFPKLLSRIVSHGILSYADIPDSSYYKDFYRHVNLGLMKTQMADYVFAIPMRELNNI
jgi:hypothetical protein